MWLAQSGAGICPARGQVSSRGFFSLQSGRQRKEELPFEFKARQFGYTWSKPKGSVGALAWTAHDVANQHWQHWFLKGDSPQTLKFGTFSAHHCLNGWHFLIQWSSLEFLSQAEFHPAPIQWKPVAANYSNEENDISHASTLLVGRPGAWKTRQPNLSRNYDVNTEFLAKISNGLQGRSSICRKFLAGVILSPVSDLTICTQANTRTHRKVDWRPCRHAVCFSSVLLFMDLVTHCFLLSLSLNVHMEMSVLAELSL